MFRLPRCCFAYVLFCAHSEDVCVDQADCDQVSLMQGRGLESRSLVSQGTGGMSLSARRDSMSHLMDTATALIKSGATPDVLRFVEETRDTIVNGTQLAIESEHSVAQQAIYDSIEGLKKIVSEYTNAIDTSTDDSKRLDATTDHHMCRTQEAAACASSRKCHTELEALWRTVVDEEERLHACHVEIESQWCVAPPLMLQPDLSCSDGGMGCPWNWEHQMSVDSYTYPSIAFTQPLIDSRKLAITNFNCYTTRHPYVVDAWKEWRAKVPECEGLDADWDAKAEECDGLQDGQDGLWCAQAVKERDAGAEFGVKWANALATHNELERTTKLEEHDRNMEWTSLHIVTCLLDVVYVSVTRSIEDDVPCITEDSDPEKVRLDIDTCHQVTKELTDSCPKANFACDGGKCTCLTIIYPPPPALPELPPVIEYPCTPAYVALHHFLLPEPFRSTYVDTGYQTGLQYGWPGCAAPRVCKPCPGMEEPVPDDTDETDSHVCHHHETYLMPGQMDLDSFRCQSPDSEGRPQCVKATSRCNTHSNCEDNSDEIGCESVWGPPVLTPPVTCPSTDTLSLQHLMQCGGDMCISAAGECNEFSNCENGKDELSCGCTGALDVTVTATSGRDVSISGCGSDDQVFSDRDYRFTDMGSFDSSFSFVKIANDDKETSVDNVMLRVTTHEPVTFYVVSLEHSCPVSGMWQELNPSVLTGPTYDGSHQTPHKLWVQHAGSTPWTGVNNGPTTSQYGPGYVYSKTFPAGTVSLPGNGGGKGSYLLFLKKEACTL